MAQAVAIRMPVEAIRKIGAELTRATRAYGEHHRELANVLAGSIAVQVLRIVQAWCLGRALGIDAPLAVYFGLIPLILLVMLLPVSINGIGTSQMGFVWFFGRAGVPEAEAFALSVLFVALGVVGNLPGGLLYAFGPRPPKDVMTRVRLLSLALALGIAIVLLALGGTTAAAYAALFAAGGGAGSSARFRSVRTPSRRRLDSRRAARLRRQLPGRVACRLHAPRVGTRLQPAVAGCPGPEHRRLRVMPLSGPPGARRTARVDEA